MAGNLWEGRALAPDAIASTASGDIWLSPALIAVVPADDAWLGLRELHFAAIGEVGHKFQTDAGALLPDEAQAAYSSAVAAVLGQIGATDPAAGDRLLESLCGAAGLYEGFDGLEGPALSALLSAGRAGEPSQAMEEFHWLLSGMGMPEVPGGGYASTALLNPQTRDLGLLDGGRLGQLGNHPSTEQLWHHVEDLARDGVSSALGALGLNPRAAKDAGAAITAAAEGAALGANLGGLLGPAGSLMGGIVGGLIAFFGELFGDDEAQQRSAARDVASGDRVPVHSDLPLEKDGQRTVVSQTVTTTTTVTTHNPDGTTTTTTVTASTVTTAPAEARNPAQQPPQGTCVHPSEVKCKIDDNAIDPDFTVPYWNDRSTLIGAGVPLGPGRDGLVTATANNQWAALRLAELPAVDELGVLLDGGLTLNSVYNQLAGTGRGTQTWGQVPSHEVVNRLRLEGFRPDDTLGHVLRVLRARARR